MRIGLNVSSKVEKECLELLILTVGLYRITGHGRRHISFLYPGMSRRKKRETGDKTLTLRGALSVMELLRGFVTKFGE